MSDCINPREQCDERCPHYREHRQEQHDARQNYCDQGVTNLIYGINKQALKEWMNAKTPESKKRAEKYFLSHYFGMLTDLDGEVFLELMKMKMNRMLKKKQREKLKKQLQGKILRRFCHGVGVHKVWAKSNLNKKF